jgi:hypothetical protein
MFVRVARNITSLYLRKIGYFIVRIMHRVFFDEICLIHMSYQELALGKSSPEIGVF